MSKIGILLAIACTLLFFGAVLQHMLGRKYGKVKTVQAQVVDKYKADAFTRIYSAAARPAQYYVVFQIQNKKKAFRVGEFSYSGYTVGERGTLRYKGDRLISFR